MMARPQPEPDFWPDGADEDIVRECNCAYCEELVDELERYRQGIAEDGEHQALTAFGGGADE